MATRDPYEVLGLERTATADEVKSAYRRLARRYHPDVNPNDPSAEERFKEVSAAYSILSDPEKRARYDRFGVAEDQPQGDFFGGGGGGLGDIFEMFFGHMSGGRRNPGQNGEDLQTAMQLTLKDVVTGTTHQVTYSRMASCEACEGSGSEKGTEPENCQTCQGTGTVTRIQQTILGSVRTSMTCNTCGGMGRIIKTPCSVCKGKMRVSETRTIDVRVPPGVEDGTSIQIPGAGGDPIGFGRPGDLYVVLQVEEGADFERDGRDLHKTLRVTYAQAALGDTLTIQGVDETHEVELPAGSQPYDTIEVRGAGLPPLHGGRRGDLHLHVTVSVPRDLKDEQRELLVQLARSLGEPEPKPKSGLLGNLFKRKK